MTVGWAPIKRFAGISYGLGQPPPLTDEGVPILRATNIERGKINPAGLVYARRHDLPSDRAPLLSAGEILVVRSGAYTGDSALVTREWSGSAPGYDLRLTPRASAEPRYLAYCLLGEHALNEMQLLSTRAAQPHLNAEELGEVSVRMPSLSEQCAIADYLDAETTRIDALIAKKQQLITLLEGRRLSVLEARLHHELTGHPAVPVRHLASISGGLTLGGATVHGAEVRRPYLRVANVQDGYLDLGDVAEIDVSPEQARRFALQDGDVLMLEGNGNPDNLGRGTIWRSEIPGCLHQNHIHAVRPDRSLLVPEFFNLVVRTPFARSELTGGGGQVSIATLSKSDIAALRLPLPPIAKQRAIVDSVRRELSYVDASLRAAARQMELVAEHRQALITATVTGQHSVPGNS